MYYMNSPEAYISNLREQHIKGAWRLEKAIKKYNSAIDKENRLERLKDILKWSKEDLIKLLGIGPKTAEATIKFMEALNGTE
jgi:DNA uptake protein ComE-like DNA-binding protein